MKFGCIKIICQKLSVIEKYSKTRHKQNMTLRLQGEWRGLVVSTRVGGSNLGSSKFFRNRKTINYETTREKLKCKAMRRGNETRRDNKKSGSGERRQKNQQVKMIYNMSVTVGSLIQ